MSETATNNSVQGEETQKVNLVKISARINQKIDDVMREMAKEYGVSFSEVVRLAIDGHLEQYFGNVQYMDAEQGKEIRMRCALLGTEMQHIRNELNKIGVNVNQIAKWNNIEAEIVQLKQSMAGKTAKERYEIVERVQFLQKCQNEILLRVVQPSDMEEYVQRYERATEGVSKSIMAYTRVTRTANGRGAIYVCCWTYKGT